MNSDEALERLNSFQELKKNWDSYGGDPISSRAINKAIELIVHFFVAPLCDGGVSLTFGENEEVVLDISAEGNITIE